MQSEQVMRDIDVEFGKLLNGAIASSDWYEHGCDEDLRHISPNSVVGRIMLELTADYNTATVAAEELRDQVDFIEDFPDNEDGEAIIYYRNDDGAEQPSLQELVVVND